MSTTYIKRQVSIKAPSTKVWDALADFGNVQQMSPNIVKSFLNTNQKNGLGATRHCDFTQMGASVDEKIIGWDEGKSIKIQLYNPKKLPMIKDMEALFELEEKGEDTLLKGTFQYDMGGALGGLMNGLMMRNMNIKSWVKFMSGIKQHVETGEHIEKNSVLDLGVVEEQL